MLGDTYSGSGRPRPQQLALILSSDRYLERSTRAILYLNQVEWTAGLQCPKGCSNNTIWYDQHEGQTVTRQERSSVGLGADQPFSIFLCNIQQICHLPPGSF